jgi:2-C-methyl-D-erythritol 4-phosphate cytidylyltransferase/2-C-methyl-D-erythritol 2,4-cyclodiphosphate synthase
MPNVAAIIPAAGNGTRMGLDHPKQFHFLSGSPILVHTVRKFATADCVDSIVVVVPADRVDSTKELLLEYDLFDNTVSVLAGGKRRQDSVKCGLDSLSADVDVVLVHDGARPLVTEEIIVRCVLAAESSGAAIAAVPVKDTLKRADDKGRIVETVDRETLWQAQTPQGARAALLLAAYKEAADQDATDEASLLEFAGIPVQLIEGSETNIKITRPDDLIIAEKIMYKETIPSIRIGHGYDAHQFIDNRDLILGGVQVPFARGLAGHSDADVLTHALCDAILGALGAGDLGAHFPDSDQKFKNIYSIKLLERVMALAHKQDSTLSNVDITVICQKPKLAAFLPEMKQNLAKACNVANDQINIKATTTEKMGFTGRMEGISCHAVVLLSS